MADITLDDIFGAVKGTRPLSPEQRQQIIQGGEDIGSFLLEGSGLGVALEGVRQREANPDLSLWEILSTAGLGAITRGKGKGGFRPKVVKGGKKREKKLTIKSGTQSDMLSALFGPSPATITPKKFSDLNITELMNERRSIAFSSAWTDDEGAKDALLSQIGKIDRRVKELQFDAFSLRTKKDKVISLRDIPKKPK
jgi:hypothetical protein